MREEVLKLTLATGKAEAMDARRQTQVLVRVTPAALAHLNLDLRTTKQLEEELALQESLMRSLGGQIRPLNRRQMHQLRVQRTLTLKLTISHA